MPPPEQEIPKLATSKAKRKRKSPEETSAQQKPSPTSVKQKRTKKVPTVIDPTVVTPKQKSRKKGSNIGRDPCMEKA